MIGKKKSGREEDDEESADDIRVVWGGGDWWEDSAGVCLTAFVCGFCFTKGAMVAAAAPPSCLFFDKGEKK